MEEIRITPPEGYEIDQENSTLECIKFKKIPKLPSKWEDLEFIDGYYITNNRSIIYTITNKASFCKDLFKTREQAEASIALAQLSQLRDIYRQGWKPDWESPEEDKYVIYLSNNNLSVDTSWHASYFLAFQTSEIRNLFLKNFKDLIRKASLLWD